MNQYASLGAEREPLLSLDEPVTPEAVATSSYPDCPNQTTFIHSPASALPLALISALALAATAATQIYVYAALLCHDPSHCDDSERRKFAASVAIATTIANALAPFTLSSFEALVRRNSRISLALWLSVRSMSVGALVLGAFARHVGIVMSSQVFEGLASDNILHFNLNAIYAREVDNNKTARLIGTSSALYMIGISISPSISSVLHRFTDSFLVAYALFACALLYIFLFTEIPPQTSATIRVGVIHGPRDEVNESRRASFLATIAFPIAPFSFLLQDFHSVSIGLVLFLYTVAQSYTFSAIMVHTSTEFGFSSRENGFLLTLVHAVASLYLFCVLFVAPRVARFNCASPSEPGDPRLKPTNAILALTSLTIQACALLCFGFIRQTWQVYLFSALLALGLAFPSFLKSDFSSRFDVAERPRALAALAAMELSAGFVSPITLGGIQALWPGNFIFFSASGLAFLACGVLFSEITIRCAFK
ncbi:hypothetical protein F5Y08DRAFT_163198 [Xylaria arbuscula]|nr:hypothetical protein F5Y08DRAFT_163198 [Xylaria arbuscula]